MTVIQGRTLRERSFDRAALVYLRLVYMIRVALFFFLAALIRKGFVQNCSAQNKHTAIRLNRLNTEFMPMPRAILLMNRELITVMTVWLCVSICLKLI